MYIADLHIHSHYSRATSKDCTPEHLDLWARRKGIGIIGSGDFTHPAWRQELKEKLAPAEDGLYVLKEEYRIEDPAAADTFKPRFVITGEISSIYKKNGRVRKVHSLILLPGLEAGEMISRKLETVGNIHSDGSAFLNQPVQTGAVYAGILLFPTALTLSTFDFKALAFILFLGNTKFHSQPKEETR